MSATGYLDACGFIPASSGTVDFVVASAITGYQTPASAGAVNTTVYSYRAESADKSQWEEGFGAYTVSTTTLARGTVTANSSGTTAKVSFSAAPNVVIVAASADMTFKSAGTGAISRMLNSKIGDFISVLDFGADSSGASDSTTAIQNAINSLSSGGTVYFPHGTYKISSAISITIQGISLIGSGRLSSVVKTTSSTANILSISASYVRVDSIGLVGTTGQVQTAGTAVALSGSQGSQVTNTYISDVYNGIQLSNSTNCLVMFNKLANIYGTYGINTTDGGGDYIAFNQLDILVYGPAYSFTSGFAAWAASTAYAAGHVVSVNGGWFVCQTAGTSASTGTGPAITAFNTLVTDGTAKWYFNSLTSSTGVLVNGTSNSNFIKDNDVSGPWGNGISISASDGNQVVGNTLGQLLGSGITAGTSATNSLFQGNILSSAYGTFALGIADTTSNTATGTKIYDNYIENTGWSGIYLQSSEDKARGNYVTGTNQISGGYGIEVAGATTKFSIQDNSINVTVSMTGAIRVNTGAADYYNIVNNIVGGGAVVDSGTGTHKTVSGNN